MKNRACIVLALMAITLVISSPALAEEKKSALDKSLESAQKAYDSGNYPRAERTFVRATKEMSKNAPDERLAKVICTLGECYIKEGKYTNAEESFKQSLEILKGLSLDQTDILDKLKQLSNLYRPINFEAIDKDAVAFANQVGAVSACAENKEDKHHIDINLKEKFQQGLQELIDGAPPGSIPLEHLGEKPSNTAGDTAGGPGTNGSASGPGTGASGSSNPTAVDSGKKNDAPPVKKLRLEKKITFDLIKQGDDGKITIANIQGISLDVGLWVKLKQFAMSLNESKQPVAEVTAGAFGVDKVVHIDLPGKLYDKLKEGLAKFDPFSLSAMQPAAAASETPGNAAPAASPVTPELKQEPSSPANAPGSVPQK